MGADRPPLDADGVGGFTLARPTPRSNELIRSGPAEPAGYAWASWLFLRLLGLVYLFAFWSLEIQIKGLVGEDGILPVRLTMADARAFVAAEHLGISRFALLPTMFWWSTTDWFLTACCVAGIVLAALLIAGIAPALVLSLLWADYLSLSIVGRDFLSFQWDALLLETGFLAILIAPLVVRERVGNAKEPPRIARWMLLWLLFRLMVSSGAVKLASGDPMWRGLTALSVHFETQPIPTPLAWFADQLPMSATKMMTAAVLALELFAPLLILGSRRLRRLGFAAMAGLQLVIALTGNYAFFNLLTVALCVWLLDDDALGRIAPWFITRRSSSVASDLRAARATAAVRRIVSTAIAVIILPVSVAVFATSLRITTAIAELVAPVSEAIAPFRIVNAYGLFAVMTPTRPEIIVEGSNDGQSWLAYEFRYKPGDVLRRPPWVAPHQPRLDWQMWFAALGGYERAPWFWNFCVRLLQGSPDVLGLLDRNPFPARPPRYVRGVLYRYRFSDVPTRRQTGAWWTREPLGEFSPPISLEMISGNRIVR